MQLHYEPVYSLKTLAHKAFDLMRLTTDVGVEYSGLNTVLDGPINAQGGNAAQIKLLLVI